MLKYLLPLLILVTPLLFLPLTPNYFSTAKQLFITLTLAALLLTFAVKFFKDKTLTFSRSRLNLPLLLFILALILNFLFIKEGRLESVTGRGALYIVGALLGYFASFASSSRQAAKWVVSAITASSSLLALHSLLHLTVLYRLDSLPAVMATRAFTPTGSPIVTLTLLVIGASVTFFYSAKSLRERSQYLGFLLGTIQTIAAVAYISLMLPGSELALNLLPYQAAWAITLDGLKVPRTFFFGVGLSNYSLLFASVKPQFLNLGAFWNALPTTSSSELLQLLSTAGLVGLLTFLFLPFSILSRKLTLKGEHGALVLALVLSLISLVLTPASIPVLLIFFVSLGLLGGSEIVELKPAKSTLLLTALLLIATSLTLVYYSLRVYIAENHIFRAQQALAAQDGKTVYQEHLAAIKLMPAMTNYRLAYSQVNLSLASALSQQDDLSDQDREQISTLVSQAIREVKLAANLRPHDARIWQSMGSLYRNLINVAEGSDQFAVSAYAEAVIQDPGNPALRVEYGSLLYQLSNIAKEQDAKNNLLSQAIQQFQTSIQLKPDYANGYYNLSKALESAGNIQGAYASMQKAVASLDPASPDLSRATTDLETLKGKLPKATPAPSETPSDLTQPSPLPSPLPGGPLELPEESVTPSPSPES